MSFQTGWNQFEIEVNGKKHQISFQVSASDNNEAVQRKVAEAINDKNIGIKASVTTDAGKKTSKLELESTNTGDDAKNKFSVSDLTSGGGAADKLGIGSVTQEAQNAIYKVGDGNFTVSKSNKIDLGDGVTVTLKKATDTPVKVSVDTDTKNAVNKVREMVNSFNGLLATAEDNKNDRGGYRLMNQLKGISSTYSVSLDRIGIGVSADGYLSIDSDKMQKAAESGELEKFFTQNGDTNYGFANKLSRVADTVSANPTDFIGKDKIHSSPTAGNNETLNYLQTYKYNSLINSGLLFDLMF
jgi:flagellar capping protein FliD